MRLTVDIESLREILAYDATTGKITWKFDRFGYRNSIRASAGDEAGTIMSNGYKLLSINGIRLLGHRVAWALYYGTWPEHDVDHINIDKLDNRIINLRLASRSENMSNRSHTKRNILKAKGIELTRAGRYAAKIWKDYKRYHIGTFDTVEEAKAAYAQRAKELHKEFARV